MLHYSRDNNAIEPKGTKLSPIELICAFLGNSFLSYVNIAYTIYISDN